MAPKKKSSVIGGFFSGARRQSAAKETEPEDASAQNYKPGMVPIPEELKPDAAAGAIAAPVVAPLPAGGGLPTKAEPQVGPAPGAAPAAAVPAPMNKQPSYLPSALPGYKPPPKEEEPFSITMPPAVLEKAGVRLAEMRRWGYTSPNTSGVSACSALCSTIGGTVTRIRQLISVFVATLLFVTTSIIFLALALQAPPTRALALPRVVRAPHSLLSNPPPHQSGTERHTQHAPRRRASQRKIDRPFPPLNLCPSPLRSSSCGSCHSSSCSDASRRAPTRPRRRTPRFGRHTSWSSAVAEG